MRHLLWGSRTMPRMIGVSKANRSQVLGTFALRDLSLHVRTGGSLRVRVLRCCVFLVAWTGAEAQLLTAKQESIYSNVLKQNRPVEVYLPKEFERDAVQRYETL